MLSYVLICFPVFLIHLFQICFKKSTAGPELIQALGLVPKQLVSELWSMPNTTALDNSWSCLACGLEAER